MGTAIIDNHSANNVCLYFGLRLPIPGGYSWNKRTLMKFGEENAYPKENQQSLPLYRLVLEMRVDIAERDNFYQNLQ
jgi:hypothetical protein